MPKTKISEYSQTAASNTDINSINLAEGMLPSDVNNAIRELMKQLKDFQVGASGDGFTFAGGVLISGTANTITGNVVMSGTNTLSGATSAAFAAGTVSAPSIYASGDTNTGVFFPAADTIAITEGGVEVVRVNSSGNVGVGTDSPGSKLDVKGTLRLSGSTSGYVGIAPAAAAGSTTYTLPSADGTSGQVLSTNGFGTLSWASSSSQWTTSGSDIYYTTGKVGVGVSTFTSGGGKLQVSDGITFPATQSASSNANTLDDYEEGTWTPSLGGNTTYSEQTGTYTKIGRQVTVRYVLAISSIGTGSTTVISGLPFTTGTPGQGTLYWDTSLTNVVTIVAYANSTSITLYSATTGSSSMAQSGIFQNGTTVDGTLTYFV